MARIRAACSSRGHVPIGEDRGRALQPRHARFRFTMASDINTWQWRTKDGRRSDMTDGQVGVNLPDSHFQNDKIHPTVLISYSFVSRHLQTLPFPTAFPCHVAVAPHPPPPPQLRCFLLIPAGDWSGCNLRRTLTNECKLFFFLSSSSLEGDEVIILVTEPDGEQVRWSAGPRNL